MMQSQCLAMSSLLSPQFSSSQLLLCRQRCPSWPSHVIRLEPVLLCLPNAKFDLQVLRVVGILATSIHLCCLNAYLLRHAFDVVRVAIVDHYVPVAAFRDKELERASIPQILPADKGFLRVNVVLHRDFPTPRHGNGLRMDRCFAFHVLLRNVELHF